ncbi:hypothetical protein [Sphingomonas sp. TREG-RG-20F-R18-01]|uniref:hypothetical protein n=1 Tax=Sphingomonas sp. TREG-RG-20F-R18-01 TaxID=2914982 RepID=UPI001F5A8F1C|nr:hypothetical protein [Sphingomonas sp. TREG-RG-20F-R18-01]
MNLIDYAIDSVRVATTKLEAAANETAAIQAMALATASAALAASPPTFAIMAPAAAAEGNSGAKLFIFVAVLSKSWTSPIAVAWSIVGTGANAADATDFTGSVFPSGSFTFGAGETSKNIVVSVNGDTTVEPNENFLLTATPTLQLSTGSATGTILNDDVTSAPVPTTLRANPPPAEPAPIVSTVNTGISNSDVGALEQYLEVAFTDNNDLYINIGMDSSNQNGYTLHKAAAADKVLLNRVTAGASRFIDYFTVDTKYNTNSRYRLELTDKFGLTLLAGTNADSVLTQIYQTKYKANGGGANAVTVDLIGSYAGDYSGPKGIVSTKAGVIGLANNPLVISNVQFHPATRLVRADVVYFVSSDDILLAQIEDLSGNMLVPYAPVSVVANATAGTATVETTNPVPLNKQGSDFNIRFAFQTHTAVVAVAPSFYPTLGLFGSNLSAPGAYGVPRPTYTNLLAGGYWQGWGDENGYQTYDPYYSPTKIDPNGNPLASKIAMQSSFPVMAPGETVRLQLDWTGGACTIALPGGGAGYTHSAITVVNANTVQFDISVDVINPVADNDLLTVVFQTIDVTNPPKNIFLGAVGADRTKRFQQSYIDFLKQLDGPMRFLDWGEAFDDGNAYDQTVNKGWSKRSHRNVLGHQGARGTPYEDYIELGQLTGRDVWLTPPLAMVNSPEGLDDLARMLKMFDTGEGADPNTITGGVPAANRIRIELSDEIWNSGRNPWSYAASIGRQYHAYVDDGSDGGNKNVASCIGRLVAQKILGQTVRSAIPTWQTRTLLELGLQMGNGDLGNLVSTGSFWNDALPYWDRGCKAPYAPADANVTGAGAQPASHAATDLVAWLNPSAAGLTTEMAAERQALAAYGKPLDIYEWNISRPSVTFRTKKDEFRWLSSPAVFAFMRDTYCPMIASVGGDSCLFNDQGLYGGYNGGGGHDQRWNMDAGSGSPLNALFDGVLAYLSKTPSRTYTDGPAPTTAPTLAGAASGSSFTITPGVWPTGAVVRYRVMTTITADQHERNEKVATNAYARNGQAAGDSIEYAEIVELNGGWTWYSTAPIILT